MRQQLVDDEGAASQRRYRTLFELAAAAILLAELREHADGLELRYVDCNLRARSLFGRSRAQLIGSSPEDLSPPEQPDGRHSGEAMLDWSAEALVGGPQVFEWRFHDLEGTLLDTEVSLSAAELDGGCYLQAVIRDLSETKRLQAALLHHQRLESIGRLAGGIAHNLNTALAPIVLAVERIRLMTDDERICDRLETIDECADRASSLVRQVVAFAQGVRDESVAVQPTELMERIVAFLELTFPRTILVSYHAKPDIWSVLGVPGQIEQVLLHLCLNARAAISEASTGDRPEGRISLSVENLELGSERALVRTQARPGRFVVMTVRDTGCGIPAQELERIFDPFYTSKQPSLGLGLSAVRGIVTSHGGFVTVKSTPDAGSELRVHLPARNPDGTLPARNPDRTPDR